MHAQHRRRFLRHTLLAALVLAPLAWPCAGAAAPAGQIGTNVASPGYDQASPIFADLAMQGTGFWLGGGDVIGMPGFDAQGYPLASVPGRRWQSILGLDYEWPRGTYTIMAEGQGVLYLNITPPCWPSSNLFGALMFDGTNPVQTLEGIGGRRPLDGKGGLLEIVESVAGNHLRNIHIYPPGIDPARDFWHPDFLESCRLYAALRFMDWDGINGNNIVRWSDRVRPGSRRVYSDNKPYEWMIGLCNLLDKDCWICIPYAADDEYIANLAILFDRGLKPGLKLYVEYANELWNWEGDPYQYVKSYALAHGMGDDAAMAALITHALSIFKANITPRRKLVRVLDGQAAWPDRYVIGLHQLILARGGDVDAIGIAPYVQAVGLNADDPDYQGMAFQKWVMGDREGAMTLLFQGMRANLAGWLPIVQQSAGYAKQLGKELVYYECGQHLTTGGGDWDGADQMTEMFIAANRHPGMEGLYHDYFTAHSQTGASLLMHYNDFGGYSKWGSWGLREYTSQGDTPKSHGLEPFLGRR